MKVENESREGKKYVYGVTLYYHSNCEVVVESDTELSREEAIDAAYSKVTKQKYQEQLREGLQEDDDADVATYDGEDYPFDKYGKLIEVYDHIMWHNPDDPEENIIAEVFDASRADYIKAKASWGGEYELLPSECVVVIV
jgi:hypothetical protein